MDDARTSRRLLALLGAAALLVACGGQDPPEDDQSAAPTPARTATTAAPDESTLPTTGTTAPAAEEVVILISDFAYEVPASVPAGAEVTVTNEDDVGHTVTSDDEGIFDVAVGPGETVTFTAPADAGEYGFFCIPHPHMTATLVVG